MMFFFFCSYLSLVFFCIKSPYIPQPLRSSIGTLSQSLGSVDVQDADRERTHHKLVMNETT